MSWAIIPEFRLPDEPEALSYIAAVEAADGQELEPAVKLAYNTFIKGCKADGIWPAIKASCILAGARTLAGALVPLVGTAPTNFNFVAGDYDRETGLKGDGSTKYLNSNRTNNADPQLNKHLSVYQTEEETRNVVRGILSSQGSELTTTTTSRISRINDGGGILALSYSPGFWGASRNGASSKTIRYNKVDYTDGTTSISYNSSITYVFSRYNAPNGVADARLSFYSIGESLDLALLDARVTTLMTALGAAIP
jgi:hypothetical protein